MGHWEEEGNDEYWFYDENEMLQHAIGNYGSTFDFHDWVLNTYDLDDLVAFVVDYDISDDAWDALAEAYENSLLQEAGPAVKGKNYCVYDVVFVWVDDDEDDDDE